jgi:hypothetical protein
VQERAISSRNTAVNDTLEETRRILVRPVAPQAVAPQPAPAAVACCPAAAAVACCAPSEKSSCWSTAHAGLSAAAA